MKLSTFTLIIILSVLSGCSDNENKNQITASGTIESVNVTVSSKVAGQVLKLNFREGDRVKAGDLLIELEHDMLDIQLRQAEAGVDLAYAQLKLLKSGARVEDLKQTEELLKQAKIILDLAELDKERIHQPRLVCTSMGWTDPSRCVSSLSKCVIDARPHRTLLPGLTTPNDAEHWAA